MQKKIITKMLVIIVIMMLVIISSNSVCLAVRITPSDIDGEDINIDLGKVEKLRDLIGTIGSFVSVGALMIIGIRYMIGSTEDKANYKKSMMPYIIRMFLTIWSINISTKNTRYV